MYKIDFYRDSEGKSELADYINSLLLKADRNKDARIKYDQIYSHVKLLMEKGTNMPAKYTKHIDEDIWELRPGDNRIFYFCWLKDTFVLLHHFRKTTEKTPKDEIRKAKKERDEYIRGHKL